MDRKRSEWERLLFVGIALLFIFLLFGMYYTTLTRFDVVIMHAVWEIRAEWLTPAILFITDLGSKHVSFPIMYILVIYFLIRKNPKLSLLVVFNLIGVREMNKWLKTVYNRSRPDELPLISESGLSFPSGHSMNSAAFIGFLGYLLWRYLRSKGEEAGYILVMTWGLIALIGFSRVYLGVHFPSDVLAGFTAGGIWLILTMMVLKLTNTKVGKT
jgi:membrane-associated phospholipid phosphatase